MKLLMLIVDGVEDTEAIATYDTLCRGGDEVTLVSLMSTINISSKYLPKIVVHKCIDELDYKSFDGLVIPGGPGSFKIMPNLPIVDELILYFTNENKLVSAICAAPHLIGKLGLLKNRNYTVHPGFENEVIGGIYNRDKGVVVDGNFITAKSMYYSIEFALAIHGYFHGKSSEEQLRLSCQGE